MGRYYFGKKDTVEDCLDVDVFWLKRHGYFCGFKSGGIKWGYGSGHESNISISVKTYDYEKYINFNYSVTNRDGQKEDFNYKVPIITTPCNLGGVRHWFVCTLYRDGVQCMRRVAKLYLPSGGKYFGCRNCYDLSYDARNNGKGRFHILGKILSYEKMVEKLGSTIKRNFYNGRPTKKYRKYIQCIQRYDQISEGLEQTMSSLFPQ